MLSDLCPGVLAVARRGFLESMPTSTTCSTSLSAQETLAVKTYKTFGQHMNDLLFFVVKITKPETEQQHRNFFCSQRGTLKNQQVTKADIYYYRYIHSV